MRSLVDFCNLQRTANQVQWWSFRLPLLVGQILHLHTRQFTGMITSLG